MCNLSDLVEERGIQKGLEQGLAMGLEQGIEQGIAQSTLDLIRKKIAKGKSFEQIVEELEETADAIRPLYERMQQELN